MYETAYVTVARGHQVMVLRTFFAIDSEALVVESSSSGGIVGDPIINNSSTPNGTIFEYSASFGRNVTIDDTGGDPDTFEDDQSGSHTVTDGNGLVADTVGVEAESIIFIRQIDSNDVPFGPEIAITVYSQGGNTSDVWGFSTSEPLADGGRYVKTDGTNNGTAEYNTFISCFGPGTIIDTKQGPKPVEKIKVGMPVWTQDAGYQRVRWVGRTTVEGTGAFAPVRIPRGTLGNTKGLFLSQEHRVLINHAAAEMLFGLPEVLIAAKHLCALPGVSLRPRDSICYTHFMFDRHHIVRSNGMLSESFFLSQNALMATDTEAKTELLSLFPSLQEGVAAFGPTAVPTLRAREASLLCERLAA